MTCALGILYWVRGYEGLLDGVESELDWLKEAVFIGVAMARKKIQIRIILKTKIIKQQKAIFAKKC